MQLKWFLMTQEQRFKMPWYTGEVEQSFKEAETYYKAWKKVNKNGSEDKINESKAQFLKFKEKFDDVRMSVKKRMFELPKSQRTVKARITEFNKMYNQNMAIPQKKAPIPKKDEPIPEKQVDSNKVPTKPKKQSDSGDPNKVRPNNSRNARNYGTSRKTNPRSQDLTIQFNPRNYDFGNYPRNGPNYSNAQDSFDSRSYNQKNNMQNLYGPQNQEFRRDFGFDNTSRNNYQYQNTDNFQRNNYNSSGQMNNYNSREPMHNYNSREPMNNYNSRELMNNYNSREPMNNYNSSGQMNNYNSREPMNNYNSREPMNNYNSSGQMNNYNSREPMNNYNSREPMNNYSSREPPMNNYNNPDAPIIPEAFGHILQTAQNVLASNRSGFNNSRGNNRW